MSGPLLSCRGLDVRFGDRWLVRGLQLDVRTGERWVVVGPNGAGKSSLLLVLAGVRLPEGGSVGLAGLPLGQWSVERLAGLRALVADRWIDPFPTTVLETVMAARYHLRGHLRSGTDRHAGVVARQCLAQMDCAALAGRDVRTLSRGERQRAAVAAAMAQETALMLLDEPISHQDPRHQIEVLQRLAQRPSFTCMAALHDINAAARFGTHALLLYGDGRWRAGPAADTLVPVRLSELFGTQIVQVVADAHRVFVSMGGVPT